MLHFRISQLPHLLFVCPHVFALVLALLFSAQVLLAADMASDEASIEAAKKALAGGGRFPWYDRSQDDVRRLRMTPREMQAERGEKWQDNSAPKTPTFNPTTRTNYFGGVLQWLGLTALVLLLGVIAYMLVIAFLKDEVSENATVRKVVESRRDADRVEALPFHVRAASGDFLSEARRLYEAGNYSQAIIYLFSHELVQLDKHHVIRLTKGKTNRQYIRETRQRPAVAAVLECTMIVFEDAFFGKKQISREAFERCWRQLDAFEAELNRLERVAA